MRAWEASIDPRLVARLVRPVVCPGMIGMALVRRILAGVAAMTERLPLLARFGGRRELAATTSIVHARWLPSAPVEATVVRPAAQPIVLVAPGRTIERFVERFVERGATSTVLREPAQIPALGHAREGEPALPSSAAIAPVLTIEGVVALATSIEPAVVAAHEAASVPESPRPAVVITHPHAVASTTLTEARAQQSPASTRAVDHRSDLALRRSRVGAPLPARPPIAARLTDAPGPPRAVIVPFAREAPTSPGSPPGRSIAQPADETPARSATASAPVRVRPRATVVDLMPSTGSRRIETPVVAINATRETPAIPSPSRSTPVVAPVTRSERSLLERRLVPVVQPARTGEAGRAREIDLPLAHPPPAALPAATAAQPAEPSSPPVPVPRVIATIAAPPVPASPKIDLHRLAEQVQRILVRQAEHARARQGLPR